MPRTNCTLIPWTHFVDQHATAWLALWERCGALPDLSPAWAQAVVRAHDLDDADLHVVAAWDAQDRLDLVYVLRTRRRSGRLALPVLEPLQNTFGLYAQPLSWRPMDEAARHIMAALDRANFRWAWLDIHGLEQGSPFHAALCQLTRSEVAGRSQQPGNRSPHIRLEGRYEDYLAARSKRFRKAATTLAREVHDNPSLAVRIYTQPEEMPELLRHLLAIETGSWKHEAGTAITARDWERRTYEHLLPALAERRVLMAAVLFVDGEPAAHHLLLRQGSRVLGLKGSYHQAHARLAPGKMLHCYLLEQVTAEGCTEYDFLGADEDYKLQWATGVRERVQLRLYRRSGLGWTLARLESWRKPRTAAAASAEAIEPEAPAPAAANRPTGEAVPAATGAAPRLHGRNVALQRG